MQGDFDGASAHELIVLKIPEEGGVKDELRKAL
jgi:hypothetical protein